MEFTEEIRQRDEMIDRLQTQLDDTGAQLREKTASHDKLSSDLATQTKHVERLLVQDGLSRELLRVRVTAPELQSAVKAMFVDKVRIVTEDDRLIAKVGDKPLADFITTWARTEEAKHFIAAPINTGGGASGSSGRFAPANPGRIDGSKAERVAYFHHKLNT